MDLKLYNGDFVAHWSGRLQTVDGPEEIVQRALVRLTVPNGPFLHDPELGSRLFELSRSTPAKLRENALAAASEALEPIAEAAVTAVDIREEGDKMYLSVYMQVLESEQVAEVEL